MIRTTHATKTHPVMRKDLYFQEVCEMKEMFKKGFSFTMGMYAAHIATCVLNDIAKSKTKETSIKEESKAEEES